LYFVSEKIKEYCVSLFGRKKGKYIAYSAYNFRVKPTAFVLDCARRMGARMPTRYKGTLSDKPERSGTKGELCKY
jgi:hypothetical protein